ncbi:unnamed protein product [Cuscuta epithymum]|uniref:Secreted protein n=1 Tax=Cuscuta epithymum TaxID=186058 RepID=A0AAV0F9E0_9ASTE|nr:unnamed protein product [Cuscuta epithymum]
MIAASTSAALCSLSSNVTILTATVAAPAAATTTRLPHHQQTAQLCQGTRGTINNNHKKQWLDITCTLWKDKYMTLLELDKKVFKPQFPNSTIYRLPLHTCISRCSPLDLHALQETRDLPSL